MNSKNFLSEQEAAMFVMSRPGINLKNIKVQGGDIVSRPRKHLTFFSSVM